MIRLPTPPTGGSSDGSLLARIISAALLLPLLLAAPYLGIWPSALLLAAGITACLWELYGLLHRSGYRPLIVRGHLAGLLFCGAVALPDGSLPDPAGAALVASLLLIFGLPTRGAARPSDYAITFAGACYIGWLLSHYLLLLKLTAPLQNGWLALPGLAPGAAWVYLAFGVNWTYDSVAFFVGRTWGRHPIAPAISPKKSYEGTLAGMAAGALFALVLVGGVGLPIAPGAALLLGLAGGIAAFLGDLVISIIKRQAGAKDASRLLPGHGGLLDRADGMLLSAPAIYYLALLLTSGQAP